MVNNYIIYTNRNTVRHVRDYLGQVWEMVKLGYDGAGTETC